MSALSDTVTALKNVVLMQERLEVARTEIAALASSVGRLADDVNAIDRRVVRIETMIEMSGRGSQPPRIEG